MEPTRKVLSETGESFVKKGRSIEFERNVYETTDKDEIKFVRNHPSFGVEITEVTGEGTPPAEEAGEMPMSEMPSEEASDDEEAA